MNLKTLLVTLTMTAALALPGAPGAAAQGSTPVAGAMGYPELKVTITDQSYELSAQEVPAGLVTLTVTNSTKEAGGAAVIGPPAGKSLADFMAEVQATPAPSDEFPAFLFQATIPGGPGEVEPGATSQAIVNLPAGDWAVFGEGSQPPSVFKTTGAATTTEAPATSVTVVEQEMAFLGLNKPLPAGPQIWKVVDQGKQPHMLVIGKVPETTTLAQVMEAISREENATPPPGGLQESDFQSIGGVLLQSSDQTVYPVFDLQPGRYVAMCFVPDPANGGVPHAMEGMISLFDVGAPSATPAA